MGTIIDMTGKTFGHLTVLSYAGKNPHGDALWLCQCDCGKTGTYIGSDLRNGRRKSCGCRMGREVHDLTGKRFDHVTVLYRDPNPPRKGTYWVCRCDCGNLVSLPYWTLKKHKHHSCGKCQYKYNTFAPAIEHDCKEGTKLSLLQREPNKKSRTSATGYCGVYPYKKGGYRVIIQVCNKDHHIGIYATLKEAVEARNRAAEQYHLPLLKKYKDSFTPKTLSEESEAV